MSNIGDIGTPFEQCDTDSQTVDSTGGTVAALFTNLAFTTGRGIMIQNRGNANLLFGKSAAAARWVIAPGATLTVYPRDLAKVAIKSSGASVTVDCLLVV